MRFTEETTKAIRKWLKKNKFNCDCRLSTEMEYDPNRKCIEVPIVYDDSLDCNFMKWLRNNGLVTDYDCLTLSILHELGHYLTYDNFSKEEWVNFHATINVLSYSGLSQEEFIKVYWDMEQEKVANLFAIEYTNTHKKECDELEIILSKTIQNLW